MWVVWNFGGLKWVENKRRGVLKFPQGKLKDNFLRMIRISLLSEILNRYGLRNCWEKSNQPIHIHP